MMAILTPGIALLARGLFYAAALCLALAGSARVNTHLDSPISTWLLVFIAIFSLTVSVAIRINVAAYRNRRKAASLGARLAPCVPGKFIGNLDVLFENMKRFENGYPGDGFMESSATLGQTFNLRVLWDDNLITTEPKYIQMILATDFENYIKGDDFKSKTMSVLGTGVFNSDGDMWKFHRKLTRPFFNHDRISHFNTFDRHAEAAIIRMKTRFREGHPVDFQDLISRFTLDSATEFLFDNCVHSLSADLPYPHNIPAQQQIEGDANKAEVFARAFAEAQFVISQRLRMAWAWPLLETSRDRTTEPMEVVSAYLEPILEEAIRKQQCAQIEGGEKSDEVSDEDTLLDHLVRFTTDRTVLKDEILNIMIAGRDTTASTLTFAVYLLATHPHALARLREEVLARVGPSNKPSSSDIKNLKYLRAVINETLRLFPAVPFNVRSNIRDTIWPALRADEKPIFIPAGTKCSYSVFLMHRRIDLWGPDAEQFDPDRFIDERLSKYLTPRPFIFLPFNAGPRICLGQQFAYNEMSFMLIRLMQNFSSFTLAPEAQSPDTLPPATWSDSDGRKATEKVSPKLHLTMYAHGGLWVRMKEANKESTIST